MQFAVAVGERKPTSQVMIKARHISQLILGGIVGNVAWGHGHEIAPIHAVFAHVQEDEELGRVVNFRESAVNLVTIRPWPTSVCTVQLTGLSRRKTAHIEVDGHGENTGLYA